MLPSSWIKRFSSLVNSGCLLDLACGSGRHGRLFLERNIPVEFVDIDLSKVADLSSNDLATLTEIDLEDGKTWPFEPNNYSAVVVTNYLYRPHLSSLIDSLQEGGVLLYETFAVGNEKFGRPKNPNFLLKEGELLDLVQGKLQVIAYEHGQEGEKVIQRICAIKTNSPQVL